MEMSIQFDPIDKLIKITSGTSITALEVYNAVMDWCDEQENMGYTIPMKAVGKFPMGGGVNSDSIFILINGWKIKLYDGNYQFTFKGTIITDDESPRTVPPDSGNVEMVFQTASQATVVTQGSGVTEEDKQDIANLINPNIVTVSSKVDKAQEHITNIEHVSEGKWAIVTEDGTDYLVQYKNDAPKQIHKKYELVKKNGVYVERIPVEV